MTGHVLESRCGLAVAPSQSVLVTGSTTTKASSDTNPTKATATGKTSQGLQYHIQEQKEDVTSLQKAQK